jgi:hypothetical protein
MLCEDVQVWLGLQAGSQVRCRIPRRVPGGFPVVAVSSLSCEINMLHVDYPLLHIHN